MESRVGSTDHHLVMAPDNDPIKPPTSIFVLPPEIRQLIWEYAISDGKILRPRGVLYPPLHQWIIHFHGWASQPSLTQVCRETRQFMLHHGVFIFGTGPTEPGLWWNPKIDTLLFTRKWDLRFEWNALEELRGLDQVKNVIIDQDLARWISYRVIYPKYDSDQRPIEFRFCYPSDSPHLKFFLFIRIRPEKLTIFFEKLLQDRYGGPNHQDFDVDAFPDQRVDFDFPNDDLDEVERNLLRLRSLWMQTKQQNQSDRYVIDTDYFMEETGDRVGPVFLKGAWCEEGGVEEEDESVHVSLRKFFKEMDSDSILPLF